MQCPHQASCQSSGTQQQPDRGPGCLQLHASCTAVGIIQGACPCLHQAPNNNSGHDNQPQLSGHQPVFSGGSSLPEHDQLQPAQEAGPSPLAAWHPSCRAHCTARWRGLVLPLLLLLLPLTRPRLVACEPLGSLSRSTSTRSLHEQLGPGGENPGPEAREVHGRQLELNGFMQPVTPLTMGPRDLAKCMLHGQTARTRVPITWKRAMQDIPGTLHVQAMWWSRKVSALPVTIVTQLSASRLTQLSAQSRCWEGPLSAAVYVPLLEEQWQDVEEVEVDPLVKRAARTLLVDDTGSRAAQPRRLSARAAKFAQRTLAGVRAQLEALEQEFKFELEQLPAEQAGTEGMLADAMQQAGAEVAAQVAAAAAAAASQQVLRLDQQQGLRALSTRHLRPKLSPENQEVLRLAQQAVHTLHASSERLPWACHLNIVLVFEVVGDPKAASLLYPVNQLRNLARLQAQTDLIAQLDVDMLPSNQFGEWLRTGNNAADMVAACSQKSVYVMPAFEVHGSNVSHSAALADEYVARPKADLEAAVVTSLITHFDAMRFPQGHNGTNFPRWFRSSEPYAITYSYRSEPWLVVHRKLAPWHDVRFRGYGNNKIQQVCHLNATGYTFLVHPTAFIIHRAHAVTDARKQLMVDLRRHQKENAKRPGSTNNFSLYGHTKLLFERAKELMDVGTYTTVLDPVTRTCIDTLPWYKSWDGQ